MNPTDSAPEDTSELLGMQSKAAGMIAAFFLLTDLATRIAFADESIPLLVNLLAFAIIAAAVAAELLVRGDPLPLQAAVPIAAAPALALALELAVAPVPLTHPARSISVPARRSEVSSQHAAGWLPLGRGSPRW
jgi:hypothetical protein